MTALQTVCAAVGMAVLIAVGLIVTGVALLAGLAWALIAGGTLLAAGAVASGVALLAEPAKPAPPPSPLADVR